MQHRENIIDRGEMPSREEKNNPVKIRTNQKPSREMKVGMPKRCRAAAVSTGEPSDRWAL